MLALAIVAVILLAFIALVVLAIFAKLHAMAEAAADAASDELAERALALARQQSRMPGQGGAIDRGTMLLGLGGTMALAGMWTYWQALLWLGAAVAFAGAARVLNAR